MVKKPSRTIGPRLLILATLYIYSVANGQTKLISDKTIQVSYNATKTESGKKKDTWQIDVIVQTPAGDSYFESAKTGNPLTDIANNRYLKISVANHAGVFSSGDKFFTAEKANLVTSSTTTVYEITGSEHRESYAFDVPTGSTPDVHAELLAELKDLKYLPIRRASPEELSTGTQVRMFLIYKELDTMLLQRAAVVRFMNAKNKPAQATFGNGGFLVRNDGSATDTLTATLVYSDWNNRKTTARVMGDHFEISLKGNSSDAQQASELQLLSVDGEKRLIRLEPVKKNVMLFNMAVPANALPKSDNGTYSLVMGNNGSLQVKDNSTSQVVWSHTDVAAAPSGFTVQTINDSVMVNLIFYKQDPNGIPERGAFMTIGDDGHLRIFRGDGYAMWENSLPH